MDLSLVRESRSHKPCSQRKKKELPKSILTFSSSANVYSFPQVSQIKVMASSPLIPLYMISQCFLLMTQPSKCAQNSMTIYHFCCFHLFPDTPIFCIIAESTNRSSCFYSHLPTHTDAVSTARGTCNH